MLWRCPACRLDVRHDALDGAPRVGVAYRCHVCRLDLLFNADQNQMEVAPFHSEHGEDRKLRSIPSTRPSRTRRASQ